MPAVARYLGAQVGLASGQGLTPCGLHVVPGLPTVLDTTYMHALSAVAAVPWHLSYHCAAVWACLTSCRQHTSRLCDLCSGHSALMPAMPTGVGAAVGQARQLRARCFRG